MAAVGGHGRPRWLWLANDHSGHANDYGGHDGPGWLRGTSKYSWILVYFVAINRCWRMANLVNKKCLKLPKICLEDSRPWRTKPRWRKRRERKRNKVQIIVFPDLPTLWERISGQMGGGGGGGGGRHTIKIHFSEPEFFCGRPPKHPQLEGRAPLPPPPMPTPNRVKDALCLLVITISYYCRLLPKIPFHIFGKMLGTETSWFEWNTLR